jgi:hypothetical protein
MKGRAPRHSLAHLLLVAVGLAYTASCGGESTSSDAKASGGAGGTGGTGNIEIGTCESPQPVGDSGWVACDTGILHRETRGSCPLPDPMAPLECGDCFAAPNPWCLRYGFAESTCVQGCATDSDCAPVEVCFCQGSSPGRCMPADCKVDADCGEGSLCATVEGPSLAVCSYYVANVACQKEADQCVGNECNCVLKNGRRECQQGLGGCGPG